MHQAPKLKVQDIHVFARQINTRMPFRFGKAVLTEMPIIHVKLTLLNESGETVIGASASGIPPLWFDKAPGRTHDQQVSDLLLSLRIASDLYIASKSASLWDLHKSVESEIRQRCRVTGLNALTSGFGIALMDNAMVDGLCRLTRKTFHQILRQDLLGLGDDFTKWVPEAPLASIALRHTVGLADPIFTSDIEKPLRDGLPESLEQVADQYRARYYKVKISGDTPASLARMGQIAKVLDEKAGDYKVTLDGNEQFATMDAFLEFVKAAVAEKSLAGFWDRILWIEQPVERSAALDPAKVQAALQETNKYKPVIIDESDGDDESVALALSLGYKGISAKNCKGVFRTLHSYRYLKESGQSDLIFSSEDLTNVPIYPLQQDCCVAAALGITHTERNGHHYIRGFQFLSAAERDSAEREFPSLYRPGADGVSVLRIENGNLSMIDINRYGYGTRSLPDWPSLKPVLLPDRREPL